MRNNRALILATTLIILVAVFYTWGTWKYFTIPVPGGNDFLAHYSVWDLYFNEGVNPYSDEAALYTQELIRGRPAEPGEDQNRLTYPFYSILVHGPFTFVEYNLARAIYMTILQAMILVGVIITLKIFDWRPSNLIVGSVLAWSILNYPESRAVILGQFAPIAFFSLVVTLYLLLRGYDHLAGIILVVTTIKPTLVFLILPFLILWSISRKRWKFLYSFGISLATITAASLLVLPTWIEDWISRIMHYPEYTGGESPVWLLTNHYIPQLDSVGELSITLLLLLALLFVWWRFLKKSDDREFYWVLGFTILISNLIVPRSATTNYVMFLFPVLGFFAAIDRSWKSGSLVIVAILILSVVGHWWLHAATIIGNREQAILFLPIPFVVGVSLIAGRSFFVHYSMSQRAVS
jgi:hypothetical protein